MEPYDMYNLLSKEDLIKLVIDKDEEISRWFEHKTIDCQTIQEQSDLIEKLKQDKISFAVEQFEWLKEKVNNAKIHKIDMINTHELYEILDNQIKQLKEGK